MKRPPGYGAVYKRRRVWWIRCPGQKPESSKSVRRKDAEDLLDKRLREVRSGRAPDSGRVVYEDLEALLLGDMRTNRRRSVVNVEKYSLPHLRAVFAGVRATDISYASVSAYMTRRLNTGASPATVRYERALLRRMLNIAFRAEKLDRVPPFPPIAIENARSGFCSVEEIERVVHYLPAHAKGPVRCQYWTGWRTSEVLGLTWPRIDFEAREIRLDPAQTKTRKPRTFPFARMPDLAALLRDQRDRTSALERERGRIIPTVFHLDGEPIGSFRTAWRTAVVKAGLPGLRPHDMRRSAARNLVRAGVSERVVMDLCGWKTRAMFDRYNVTADRDLEDGVEKLSDFLGRRRRVARVAKG